MSINMSFTINASTASEISKGIRELAAILDASAREAGVDTAGPVPAGQPEVPATPAVEQTQAAPSTLPWEEPPATEPQAATPAPVQAPPTPTVTLEALRTKAVALAQAGKSQQLQALLQQFGVARLTDLPSDKYAEFDAALGAL